jgi:hypothetical protein
MKIEAAVGECKIVCNLVRLVRGESVKASFLEWVSGNWFIELTIASVGAINRLEGSSFNGVGIQIRGMLFSF